MANFSESSQCQRNPTVCGKGAAGEQRILYPTVDRKAEEGARVFEENHRFWAQLLRQGNFNFL